MGSPLTAAATAGGIDADDDAADDDDDDDDDDGASGPDSMCMLFFNGTLSSFCCCNHSGTAPLSIAAIGARRKGMPKCRRRGRGDWVKKGEREDRESA